MDSNVPALPTKRKRGGLEGMQYAAIICYVGQRLGYQQWIFINYVIVVVFHQLLGSRSLVHLLLRGALQAT